MAEAAKRVCDIKPYRLATGFVEAGSGCRKISIAFDEATFLAISTLAARRGKSFAAAVREMVSTTAEAV